MLDSICLFAKRIFEDDNNPQNYLVFQPVDKYFKIPTNNDIVLAWKSKTFSNESYASPTTSDNSLNSRLDYFNNSKFWSEFDGSCLKLDKITFTLIKIIHLHITYEIMAILWWQ